MDLVLVLDLDLVLDLVLPEPGPDAAAVLGRCMINDGQKRKLQAVRVSQTCQARPDLPCHARPSMPCHTCHTCHTAQGPLVNTETVTHSVTAVHPALKAGSARSLFCNSVYWNSKKLRKEKLLMALYCGDTLKSIANIRVSLVFRHADWADVALLRSAIRSHSHSGPQPQQ